MRGPDPLLPGGVLGQYSHDQLFFLSFSNVWCNRDSPDKIKNQLYDVHSPGKYRILGTLQNYPEFRAAFQCPADSTYGPEKHCNVWISEPATRSGPKKTPNIPSLPVSSDDKYQQAAQYFATNMNTTYNPCENFYEYACDAFSGSVDYFTQTQAKVIESIVAYLDKLPATAPKPVQQWKQLIDQCVVYLKNPEVGKAGGIYVKRQVDTFKQRSTI
ncbi:Protein NEP-17 b, partial [Aphelenchoides avenae]